MTNRKQSAKERPFINLPNGKRTSFAYLSRVANGDKPISLDQLKKSHIWSTLEQNEKLRLLSYFKTKLKTLSIEKIHYR